MHIVEKINKMGTVSFLVLLLLSVLFFKERTIFLDLAFHLFYIIKDGEYAIQNNRFGSIITQSFPLLTSKLGLPLKHVMLAYSMGFALYYAGIFLICWKVLKQPLFAVLMVGFSILMTNDTFYWVQSELPQGIAFLILFLAFLSTTHIHDHIKTLRMAITFIMAITVVFFHPLLNILLLYTGLYFLWFNKKIIDTSILKNVLFFAISILIFKTMFLGTEYDNEAMGGASNIFKFFPNYFTIPSNTIFIKDLFTDYYGLFILGIILLYHFMRSKDLLKLTFVAAFFFGYLGLVNISYPDGGEKFYMENLYLPLGIILLMPAIFDILPTIKWKYAFPVIALFTFGRIVHIYSTHTIYSDRLSWQKNYLHETDQSKNKKLLVKETPDLKKALIMTWASPYEFWLLSTLESDLTRSITIMPDPDELKWAIGNNNSFITKWGIYDYNELPKQYFIFKDSSSYQIIDE